MTIPISFKVPIRAEISGAIKNQIKYEIKAAVKRKHARLAVTSTNIQLNRVADKIHQYLTDKVIEFKKSGKSVAMLKAEYRNEIFAYIEAQVTFSYILGLKYMHKSHGTKPDLSMLEEHKIRLLAKRYADSFWKNLQKSQKEVLDIKGASFFDFIQALARMITFHAVNDATVQFGMQLSAGLRPDTVANEPVYEFVTMRDDRVDCRICAPLDGMLMSPSDPEWAQPPLHYNCRCRLLLHSQGQTLSG